MKAMITYLIVLQIAWIARIIDEIQNDNIKTGVFFIVLNAVLVVTSIKLLKEVKNQTIK